ncbi:MAG: hypothetical protein HQL58_09565 [Magnetococcales bacterium]|nr:hypothetical protein [Magnetococcales bacterium]
MLNRLQKRVDGAVVITEQGRDLARLVSHDLVGGSVALACPDYDAMVSATRQDPCMDQPVSDSISLSLFHIFRLTLDETTMAWRHSPGSFRREPTVLLHEKQRIRRDLERLCRCSAPATEMRAIC